MNQQTSISYFDKDYKFGNIQVDAVISLDVGLSNIVSEHPLESRDILNDAIHNEPIRMRLTVVIADMPQTNDEYEKQKNQNNTSAQRTLANSKSLRAWKDLYALWKAKQLLQILTPLQSEPFEDMSILFIDIPCEDTESLTFTVDLKQLLITENLTKFNLAPEIGKQSKRP